MPGPPSHGRACVRFDYSGHGESGGDFVDGTIGQWLEDSLAAFDAACQGPQVVIGSSMGGWMALLLARALARRGKVGRATLKGLVLIAPAPDFTEELMWKGFSPEIRAEIETTGQWLRPSEYGEPYPITRRLIEEGAITCCSAARSMSVAPCGFLQGRQDPDVPWQHAFRAGRTAAERGCGADHDPGRRPSAVAPAGHCATIVGCGGVLIASPVPLNRLA